ncbi:MAG: hypothetical protein DHS20C18_38930 [Saprospiraceae bacterium]|nr:MAG: hypothetical protein DHS20C18_38930 [Saprospiraceae bacterium]
MNINNILIIFLTGLYILFLGCGDKKNLLPDDPIPETVDTIFYESGKYGGFPIGSNWVYHYKKHLKNPMTGEVFVDIDEMREVFAQSDTLIGDHLYQKLGPKLIRVEAENYYELITDIHGATSEWKYMDGDLESGIWTTDTIPVKLIPNDTIRRFDRFEITAKIAVYDYINIYMTDVVEIRHTEYGLYDHGHVVIPIVYTEKYAENIGLIERVKEGDASDLEVEEVVDFLILQ